MRYKIAYTVWLLLCKNCAQRDDVIHENIRCSCLWDDKYVGVVILSTVWFSNLSLMSVPYILNDNKVGGEETVYSLKGRH